MKKYAKPVVTATDVVSETFGIPRPITRVVELLFTTKFHSQGFGL
jgi:hypothetical protein